MNIVFAAAESVPFTKVGGLADVVGTLTVELHRMGHRVKLLLPHHGAIDDERHGIEQIDSFKMPWHGGEAEVSVGHTTSSGVPVYLLRCWPYFTPGETFVYSDDEGIDVGRFLFFSSAALAFTSRLANEEHWQPDLFHVHDWHTGLIPYLLRRVYYADDVLSRAAVLLTIHNMKYQGWGVGWHLHEAGLPPVDHSLLHAMDKTNNSLAVGLAYSTALNTVSPRYAQEIKEESGGYGLDGLLEARQAHLSGILNGIDTDRWNPTDSDAVPEPFDGATLEARAASKRALQERLRLPVRDDLPIIGTVIRLVDQKGPGILVPAMWRLLRHAHMQFVLLGTGFYHHENAAWKLGDAFREKARVVLAFDEELAELIYAGSDMFLMPSLFEPCGIGQMIAMRYGSIPIVREVGGLADTVTPDIGFLFRDFNPGALEWTIGQALHAWYNDPDGWRERQELAMARDFGWRRSAEQYVSLYQDTIDIHRRYTG